jgi:multiple sugar transport system ATP-binding protein
MLVIKDLTKKYGNNVAVEHLSLEIEDGEFFILLGPSGCGKTTILLSLAGLIDVDEGEIWFGDELVRSTKRKVNVETRKREVAMVFQDYALYPHKTVFDNIAFPLKIRGLNESEIKKRVNDVVEFLGLSQLLNRKPRQLSGGQRQRVALGRAIIRKPRVFLMDEPLANLDAKLRVYARVELKKLQRNLGVTAIYVTHDQVEAMTIGDRIAILNDGLLQQIGTPEDVYDNPKNVFVASFIGSPPMNILEGKLRDKNGRTVVDTGIFTYELGKEMDAIIKGAKTSDITIGIRPEHIIIIKEKQNSTFEARVELVELIGRELFVHLKKEEKSLIVITSPAERPNIGENIRFKFDENKIFFFDKKTGEALR